MAPGSLPRGVSAGQVAAMLASCDRDSAVGRRDYAILQLLTRLGLRAGEVAGITLDDIDWRADVLLVTGKASQADTLPLPADVGEALTDYVRHGRRRDAVERLLTTHANTTTQACPSLAGKHLTPHVLWHSAAMALLHSGADITVIALWMGHESPATTRVYLHADMAMKEQALARMTPSDSQPGRYTAPGHPPGLPGHALTR